MLLTLMLFVSLLAIASLGWIQRVDFEIKREREEEMIHRGVQYSRAIKHFVKKFGRYPSRIEELENTNNIRFLRKRYKDPITGKGFKLLHLNDVQMSFSPGAASGMAPGSPGISAAGAQAGAPGALTMSANSATGPGPSSIPGNQQNGQTGATDNSGTDQSAQNGSGSSDNASGSSDNDQSDSNAKPIGNGPTFGGMPIVGVASTSKEKTIRVFNKKDHYNQWQFIYDPSTDRGGLLMTPNQPAIQGATSINQMNSPQNGNGQNQNSTFGPGGMNGPGGGMNGPGMSSPNQQQNQQQ